MALNLAQKIINNAKIVILLFLIGSIAITSGITMMERSTSMNQFQTDANEADALDYVEANFSTHLENTTNSQVIIRDEDVLDKDTLISILEYEKTLYENKTVNETLTTNNSIKSISNLIATTSIQQQEKQSLYSYQKELNETKKALKQGFYHLLKNPGADKKKVFEDIETNTTLNLSNKDYLVFKNATSELKQNIELRNDNKYEIAKPIIKNAIKEILKEEHREVQQKQKELKKITPSINTQINQLKSLNNSQINSIISDIMEDDEARDKALIFLPNYYNINSTSTNATLVIITQETPGASFVPGDAPESIEDSQIAISKLASEDNSISAQVYGNGIVSSEILDSMTDSILLVGPLALLFVLLVLIFVYRDVLDIVLGLLGIILVLSLTFGTMGWMDISFSQPFIIVIVLLIGLSIDYGIHIIMRYRETSEETPSKAMAISLSGVGVALVYTTITTMIGFLSNLASPLFIFRQLGIISAIGIITTLLVFSVFIPALKSEIDFFLESHGVNRFKPAIGTKAGPLNRVLDLGGKLAIASPYLVLVLAILISGIGVYGATQIDSSFEQSDFLAEDPGNWTDNLPEPFNPGNYGAEEAVEDLNENFIRRDTTTSVLVKGDITDPETLEQMDLAQEKAEDLTIVSSYPDGEAAIETPITLMHQVAEQNESFSSILVASDIDGDGVPDKNVTTLFDALSKIAPEETNNVIYHDNEQYKALRMKIIVEGDASGEAVLDQMETVASIIDGEDVSSIETGDAIINQITANQLAKTAIFSLVISLISVLVVISIAYRLTEGSFSLGAITIVPVGFTLSWVLGSMAALEIPFNIVTGMITGLTIGMGVDYAIHISERFNQELNDGNSIEESLHRTVISTGGALLSSAATTAGGFAVLLVAILPFLKSFGLITALTILYAFIASVFVLPSLLVIWKRMIGVGEGTSSEPSQKDEPKASRLINQNTVLPNQQINVKIILDRFNGRIFLKESSSANIDDIRANPSPIAMNQSGEEILLFWDIEETSVNPEISYTVTVPEEREKNEEVVFDGVVETRNDEYSISGNKKLVVVEDVFQRVLEEQEITATDLKIALNDDEVTEEQINRLKEIWLRDEFD